MIKRHLVRQSAVIQLFELEYERALMLLVRAHVRNIRPLGFVERIAVLQLLGCVEKLTATTSWVQMQLQRDVQRNSCVTSLAERGSGARREEGASTIEMLRRRRNSMYASSS